MFTTLHVGRMTRQPATVIFAFRFVYAIAFAMTAIFAPAAFGQETPDESPAPEASAAPQTFEERLNIQPVGPRLLRGATLEEGDVERLAKDMDVKSVVSLLSDTEQPPHEKAAVEAAGMTFKHVPAIKNPGASPLEMRLDVAGIRGLIDDLKNSEGRTYIHCQKGRDRSGCVGFAYRVLVDDWSYADAIVELLQRGFNAPLLPGMMKDIRLLASGLDELPEVPVQQRPKMQGKRIKVNDTELYVHTMGEGPPLYLIHGGPGENHMTFRPYLDDLAKDFTLVYFDLRGCGQSDKPPFDELYLLDTTVADIDGLRQALGHEKISLLGQSTGGIAAMRYAMDHPDHVDKLVLLACWAHAEEYRKYATVGQSIMNIHDLQAFRQVLRKAGRRDRNLNDGELGALLKIYYPYNFFGVMSPEGQKQWAEGTTVSAQVYYATEDELLKNLDLRDRLSGLSDIPTLVTGGKFDLIAPPPVLKTIAEGIGDSAELVVFDQSGHFPYVEEHDKFIKTVTEFLGN